MTTPTNNTQHHSSQENKMPTFRITHNGLSITITSCKTQQAACRTAFNYWIREKLIKKQPKSSNDWDSSFKDVYVEVLR